MITYHLRRVRLPTGDPVASAVTALRFIGDFLVAAFFLATLGFAFPCFLGDETFFGDSLSSADPLFSA